jgi:hypothetical protein
MDKNTSHRQPTIHSPGARRLTAYVRTIRRREPNFDRLVDAIREGDNLALHALLGRAQHGNAAAAVAVIWALLPRLAAVVINREPVHAWHAAMDDYLSVTYLTLVDVDLAATADHLSDKIVARTRRRVERSNERPPLALCRPDQLEALAPSGDDVEQRALARNELQALQSAVHNGLLGAKSWQTLLEVRFIAEPGTVSARRRKAASRARVRLQEWSGQAA